MFEMALQLRDIRKNGFKRKRVPDAVTAVSHM